MPHNFTAIALPVCICRLPLCPMNNPTFRFAAAATLPVRVSAVGVHHHYHLPEAG